MTAKLFQPYDLKGVQLKNRIVMAPMCVYSSDHTGEVKDWHLHHYAARAVGQVGMLVVEATGVLPVGRITEQDLGIWCDEQIIGLRKLVETIKNNGSVAAIQIGHAGRKSTVQGEIMSSSAIAFDEASKVPKEMTKAEIDETVEAFGQAARRAKEAGFDVIEIHAAHGYLINQFLSPIVNKRQDEYGGSKENQFRFLKEVVTRVKEDWNGPLLARISATDHHSDGLTIEDYIEYSSELKELGVDLIDVSSGGLITVPINIFPGYQISYAEKIKHAVDIDVGAVGLITTGLQAEEILQNERADLIFIGRELLRDPYWPRTAAKQLDTPLVAPVQYNRGW